MANKLSNEKKTQFINSNMSLVPEQSKELFSSWDLDKQYLKMQGYVRNSKKSSKAKEISPIKMIDNYLKKKECDSVTVCKIVEKCNKWLDSNKKKELDAIQKQIDELQAKQQIIMNS